MSLCCVYRGRGFVRCTDCWVVCDWNSDFLRYECECEGVNTISPEALDNGFDLGKYEWKCTCSTPSIWKRIKGLF